MQSPSDAAKLKRVSFSFATNIEATVLLFIQEEEEAEEEGEGRETRNKWKLI